MNIKFHQIRQCVRKDIFHYFLQELLDIKEKLWTNVYQFLQQTL